MTQNSQRLVLAVPEPKPPKEGYPWQAHEGLGLRYQLVRRAF